TGLIGLLMLLRITAIGKFNIKLLVHIVIVFTSFVLGNELDRKQIALINVAINAGIKYSIPLEWAPDTASRIGILALKRVTYNYLLCRAAEKKLNFCVIYLGVLFKLVVISLFENPSLISNKFYYVADSARTSYSTSEVRRAALANIEKGIYRPTKYMYSLMTPFFRGL
ncbi:unnamed protein product, partial [Aureobasidium pullulans]